MYMMASISLFVTSKAKANIAQNRAFAGFINTVYLNVDAVNNGNHLCIFGVDEISLQLRSVVKREWLKNIGEEVDPNSDYNECRVIYIAKNKEKNAKHSVQFFNDKGALTIATFSGFVADGGMMNVSVGRRNFELTANEMKIKKSGVKIDPSIISLIVR